MGVRGMSFTGSYSSLGFRAPRKDVDWTLAETAEHLSGH